MPRVIDAESLPTPAEETELVYFDVETTGRSHVYHEVLQIGACYQEAHYSANILPRGSVSRDASAVNGFTKVDGKLLLHGEEVPTVPRAEAWSGFLDFLRNIGKKIVLVAHNASFDMRFFRKEMSVTHLKEQFDQLIFAHVCTVNVFKNELPGLASYKQGMLAEHFSVQMGTAHNALNDVLTLQAICKSVPNLDITKYIVGYEGYCKKQDARASLAQLKVAGITDGMIGKMAGAGIDLGMIHDTFIGSGADGVESLLADEINGKPRVTKTQRIINTVIQYLKECYPEMELEDEMPSNPMETDEDV